MEQTEKPNTHCVMKHRFGPITAGLLIIACITFGWWGSAIGSDSLLNAQKQTREAPPPDPSGAGSPGDDVSCFATTEKEVKPGDTIHLRIQTVPLPPAGTYAAFWNEYLSLQVPGVQGVYEMSWQVPQEGFDPSIYYNIWNDSTQKSFCTGAVSYRLIMAPRIDRLLLPSAVFQGDSPLLRVDVTGSADLTYEWRIGETLFKDGPKWGNISFFQYHFNTVGTTAVTVTVTNELGSTTQTREIIVGEKRPSVQFTKQPSGVVAPTQSLEWCIRYSGSSLTGYTLTCAYGDGASYFKEVYDREGTVCVQHAYQNTGEYMTYFTINDTDARVSSTSLSQLVTVAGCPPGYEKCGDACMPVGKGCCESGTGYCEMKSLCCGTGCCTVLQFCHEGGCCDLGSVVCPGQANCCAINQTCCAGGGCCEGPCCGSGCCGAGEQCCGETHCCPTNKVCTATGCADPTCLPSTNCCTERPVVCASTCCAPGTACCGTGCMPAGNTCCETYNCSGGSGQTCCGDGTCCPAGHSCCAGGGCCAADSSCCGGGCCPNSAVCGTDGSCCAQGDTSCKSQGGSGCCPGGSECCGGSACCVPGTCNHSTGQCTGTSAQSIQQKSSGNIQRSAISPLIQMGIPEVPADILNLFTK